MCYKIAPVWDINYFDAGFRPRATVFQGGWSMRFPSKIDFLTYSIASMSIISNEIDPITLEPLENCERKFSWVHKNVKTMYDFDNYYENIKKIGEIKPHSGEKLTLSDKICFNKVCKYFNEPIAFPEAEREREKERKREREEHRDAVITFIILVPIMILEFIFLIRCKGLTCIGLPF